MFVNIDLYRWTADETREGESALRAHMKTSVPGVTPVVAGRAIQEASRRFNYGLITKFDDFNAWDAWVADEDVATQWMTTPLASPRWLPGRRTPHDDSFARIVLRCTPSSRAARDTFQWTRSSTRITYCRSK